MKIPIPSIGHVALLASAILFASSANAASDEDGIIIYNAQHESLQNLGLKVSPKIRVSKSRYVMVKTVNWAIN